MLTCNLSKNTWQVLRKGAMLKGSSVTVTEDLSRWAWHLLFSVQLRTIFGSQMLMRSCVLLLKCRSQNRTCCESESIDVRRIRQCRAELRKFMRDVKKGNPAATVLPLLTFPTLSKSFLCCTTIFTTILQNEMIHAGTPAVWQALRWREVLCLEWSQRKGDTDQSWKLYRIFSRKTFILMIPKIMMIPS